MAKMKSSLLNMVLSLSIITLVAAGLLAGAYMLTKDTIKATEAKNIAAAKLDVLPQMEGLVVAETGETVATELGDVIIYKACAGEAQIGAAIEALGSGFGGEFKLMVGIVGDTISGFKVLAHQETPGLGAKMGDWFATDKGNQKLAGHHPAQLQVIKKGESAAEGNEPLDAITAATISSKAFVAAVQNAYEAYAKQHVEGLSGATTKVEDCQAPDDANVQPENVEEN